MMDNRSPFASSDGSAITSLSVIPSALSRMDAHMTPHNWIFRALIVPAWGRHSIVRRKYHEWMFSASYRALIDLLLPLANCGGRSTFLSYTTSVRVWRSAFE